MLTKEKEIIVRNMFDSLVLRDVFFPWSEMGRILILGEFFADEVEMKADVTNMRTAKVFTPKTDSGISGNVAYRAIDAQRIILAKRESERQREEFGKKPFWKSLRGEMASLVRQSNKLDNHDFFGDEAVERVVKAMHELSMYK